MMKEKLEVLDVVFLTPAVIKVKSQDTCEMLVPVSVDIINRKVYLQDEPETEFMSEEVFAHLDEVNTLPDDFFRAPDSIVEEAISAQAAHENLRREHAGG